MLDLQFWKGEMFHRLRSWLLRKLNAVHRPYYEEALDALQASVREAGEEEPRLQHQKEEV